MVGRIGLVVIAGGLAACAAWYPPGSPPWRPEPTGPYTVEDLLAMPPPEAEAPPAAADGADRPHLHLRVTDCEARTVAFVWSQTDVCAEVTVEPADHHRWLRVQWAMAPPEAAEDEIAAIPVGESIRSLEGAAAPRDHRIKMVDLPAGRYDIVADLWTDVDRRVLEVRVHVRLVVFSRGGEKRRA